MTLKFWLVFLLVALAMVAHHATATAPRNSTGRLVGDEVGEEEVMLDSEASRRVLASGKRYLSYAALKANMTPCMKRGRSYYYCKQLARKKVNPYKRACTVITKCYRYTHLNK
ncbi:RALFL33, putative [Ricinus communis]|uniref:RALFL33, putative n=1 Tax=Ricinus communis TaxID=3988 RepID=B9SQI5_RICCO|nr:RALFL33, putative [Ricinus communis]